MASARPLFSQSHYSTTVLMAKKHESDETMNAAICWARVNGRAYNHNLQKISDQRTINFEVEALQH